MPRPKKTKDLSGTAIGAVIGGLLGGPIGVGAVAFGAAMGGLLGSGANPEAPLPLAEAIRHLVADLKLVFVSAEQEGPFRVKIVFGNGRNNFFVIRATVPPRGTGRKKWTPTTLADALYDQTQKKLDNLT